MPNHVTSRLNVSGDKEKVKELFEAINGGVDEEGNPVLIDFNKIIPMPEELNIPASSDYEKGYAVYLALEQGDYRKIDPMLTYPWAQKEAIQTRKQMVGHLIQNDPEAFTKGKQYFDNIQNHGVPTWYEWCNKNWGTKWPAYCQTQINSNTIEFQTAWAGVPELLRTLSEKFPEVTLEYEFADEDYGHNVGEYTFKVGDIENENLPDDGSPEALKIAAWILDEHEYEAAEDEEDNEI